MTQRLRHQVLLGVLLSALVGGGCQRRTQDPTPAPGDASAQPPVVPASRQQSAAPAPSSAHHAPPPAVAGQTSSHGPRIELQDAGTEPRTELRYALENGQSNRLEMKQKMNLSMRLGGEVMPETAVPETSISMLLEVTGLDQGIATVSFSVADVKVSPESGSPTGAAVSMNHLLQDLKSYRGTQLVDNRGVLHGFDQDTSGIGNPQVAQMMNAMERSMNQMLAPLPEESVGKGARWKTVTQMDQFGLKLTQTTYFHVQRIDARGVDLDLQMAQSAPAGTIRAPGLPAGISVDLVSLDSTGRGAMRIDFARLVPKSEATLNMEMKMKVPQAAAPGSGSDPVMSMTMSMDMSIAPK